MFENITKFFKKFGKNEKEDSKTTAKERLHLVLAQDRANISADFLEMMKQEIIDVIKKYIDIDEEAIDVRMTNKPGEDGTVGAPALYANIPIVTIKNEARKLEGKGKEIPEENIEEKSMNTENSDTETSEKIEKVQKEETIKQENEEQIIKENHNEEDKELKNSCEESEKIIEENSQQEEKIDVEVEKKEPKKQLLNVKKEDSSKATTTKKKKATAKNKK